MGIKINGVNIGRNNGVVMIDGCIVSGGGAFGNMQKFDEKKNVQANGVDRIIVKSDSANIVVTESNANIIEAHFLGEAIVDEKPMFNIEKKGREVVVTLNIKGSIMGNLTLTVNIPTRTFESVKVTNYNGGVSVKNAISAKKIQLDTYNGNVDVYIDAKNDVEIQASSYNGNVSVELQNVATSNIDTSTTNGNVRNRFCGKDFGYIAYGRATSHNGNVVVK